jgi:hypothetical protein
VESPACVVCSRALLAAIWRRWPVIAGAVGVLALASCGSGQTQAANEPKGNFPVTVSSATFPVSQRLAQQTHLVITVRNAGSKPIPNLAVTICNVTCAYPAPAGEGTSVQAFAQALNQPYLANPSRPIWIINKGPGPCLYSCRNGGAGAYVTAYSNTWALGHQLAPGRSVRFDWAVTAVAAGHHVVAWEVAAGLNGKAKAVTGSGSLPHGTFRVTIHTAPAQTYVNDKGQIVTTSSSAP